MNEVDTFEALQLKQWAARQLADYDAHRPGTMFAQGVTLNVSQGYELQAAVAKLRCVRGEKIIGYKVGCTSSIIRKQLGIDHCITGRLYDTEQHDSGVSLARNQFENLAIEGELAVELSREPRAEDFSHGGIPECIARVFPVIELHHHVLRGESPSAGELIANNAIHAGVVAGRGICPEELSGEPSLEILIDGCVVEQCSGILLLETIRTSLQWLTEIVSQRGERLRAGQIVLTGSIPSLIPIRENCHLQVIAAPFGNVETKFIS